MGSKRADPPVFSLESSSCDRGRTTISVAGELDLANADVLLDAVRSALATGAVLVDLRELRFMDSAGVRTLNTALREAADAGRELRVCRDMQPNVVQVLEITGMMALLPLERAA